MSEFSKVQFIGYAICTTPKIYTAENSENKKYYLGLEQEESDMALRLKLLAQAVASAQTAFSTEPDVLRVFVVPEFFFRGNKGAYSGSGAESFLRDQLKNLMAAYGADIHIAVLGTSLFALDELDYNNPTLLNTYALGDSYMHVYDACRDYRIKAGQAVPSMKEMMFFLDELDGMAEPPRDLKLDPLCEVLRQTLSFCDLNPPLRVVNKSSVLLNGNRHLTVQKQFKSKVDFVFNYYLSSDCTRTNHGSYLLPFVKYPEISPVPGELKQNDSDPYGVFNWKEMKIGIEVCLDHVRRRMSKSVCDLDLQIIPSCGVEVENGSVAARTGGYVFNCDGDYTLENAENGTFSHTQLFRVESEGDKSKNKAPQLSQLIKASDVIKLDFDGVGSIFAQGAGELHVYAPCRL